MTTDGTAGAVEVGTADGSTTRLVGTGGTMDGVSVGIEVATGVDTAVAVGVGGLLRLTVTVTLSGAVVIPVRLSIAVIATCTG